MSSEVGAGLIYGALANADRQREATGTEWSCTNRVLGGTTASLRDGCEYLEWA